MLVKESIDDYVNELKGGKGDNISPNDVDPDQLEVGQETEMEHTDDPRIALEIALDHLSEDPEYYSTLVKAGLVDEPEALRKYRELLSGEEDHEEDIDEKEKPGEHLSKKERSSIVKRAKAGKDIGKKGKKFSDVVAAAKKGGARDPESVAAAAMWKNIK